MQTEELVEIGTVVVYHGSKDEYNGRLAIVVYVESGGYVFDDGTGGTRYSLLIGAENSSNPRLWNVRRGSFSELGYKAEVVEAPEPPKLKTVEIGETYTCYRNYSTGKRNQFIPDMLLFNEAGHKVYYGAYYNACGDEWRAELHEESQILSEDSNWEVYTGDDA